MNTRDSQARILVRFLFITSACAAVSCLNLGPFDEKAEFIENNYFNKYGSFCEIGNAAIPFDVAVSAESWKVFTFHLLNFYDSLADSVIVRTENSTRTFPMYRSAGDSLMVGIFSLRIFYYEPYLFIVYEGNQSWDSYASQIFRYDFQNDTASLVFSERTLALNVLGRSDSAIYFNSIHGTRCFNVRTCLLSECSFDENATTDTVISGGNCTYIVSSGKAYKIAASSDTLWKTDSAFHVLGIAAREGYVYAYGWEGYVNIHANYEGSDGNYDPVVAKINDNTGALEWKRNYEAGTAPDRDWLFTIDFDESGNTLCLGSSGPWGRFNNYLSFYAVDVNGNLLKSFLLSTHSDNSSDIEIMRLLKIFQMNGGRVKLLFEANARYRGVCNFYAEFNY